MIIIKTSDTDVIVLCIYFDKQMTNTSELWVQMGNGQSKTSWSETTFTISGFPNEPAM
jgi:hypothetical protein